MSTDDEAAALLLADGAFEPAAFAQESGKCSAPSERAAAGGPWLGARPKVRPKTSAATPQAPDVVRRLEFTVRDPRERGDNGGNAKKQESEKWKREEAEEEEAAIASDWQLPGPVQPKIKLRKPYTLKIRLPPEGAESVDLDFVTRHFMPVHCSLLSEGETGLGDGIRLARSSAFVFAAKNMVKFASGPEHVCLSFDFTAMFFTALYLLESCDRPSDSSLEYSASTDCNGISIDFNRQSQLVEVRLYAGRHSMQRALVTDYKILLSFPSLADFTERLYRLSPRHSVVDCVEVKVASTSSAYVHPDFLCCPAARLRRRDREIVAEGTAQAKYGASAFDDRPWHTISKAGHSINPRPAPNSPPKKLLRSEEIVEW